MNCVFETLTKETVDLSCGELIDITIRGFGTDDLLDYIVLRSSKLKSLCLAGCPDITGSGLRLAVKRLPQLEKLQISCISVNREDIEFVGQTCPQLKSFIMAEGYSRFTNCDDLALAIANNMPQLSHLEFSYSEMTNDGLQGILNGCPYLQSLDVRGCYNLNLDGKLRKLCRERIKDFKCDADMFSSCDMDYDVPYMDTFHDYVDSDCYDYFE